MPSQTMIVTSALPYANGSIHLGHLVEYIQTDIFVRFQKMAGVKCLFFCADDTHGAPIMIRAKSEGTTPEKIIDRYHLEHQRDFADFHIEFDNYHSTNSEENRLLSEEIFLKLKKAGHITTRDVEQAYCEHDKMFLPDRFVRGVCPKCGAEDQYGDVCESCGSHYSSTELKNPRCSICGAKPVRKVSDHYFFRVSAFEETLNEFIESGALQPEVKNFLATWMKEGLKDWDISRDGPYFGFKIPGEESKFFYVWLDAPVGYISSTKNWVGKKPEERDFDALWRSGDAQIHHFIGKDIVYFHTLFWIPMLKGSGFKLPHKIHVHGFLTVNGEKMSKTKGTFINARTYLDQLDPEYLRYYYASKLKNSVDDLDLSFQDFVFRVNAELVNKVANLGSRVISILNKNKEFENRIEHVHESGRQMIIDMLKAADGIAADYGACDFGLAIKKIMRLTDAANTYIDQAKPWELKNDPQKLQEVLAAGINAFRLITLYLKPVVPRFAGKVEKILKIDPLKWDDSQEWMTHHTIGKFERLAERIDIKSTEKIVEVTRKQASVKEKTKSKEDEGLIEFEDFTKIKLKTAKVIEASKVEKADKLLKLTVDLGDERRTLVAGIAKNYEPDEMIGKTVVIVSNLKPRKIMGIESNGMVLAVSDGDTLKLIGPDGDVAPGLKVS
ncbi:Methionyl-tRNA synthetase [hydrothermal vent metagenome]|uniref:Methionine--tRNA ligase n=1 Tax=hydrothermal vent metagenome TaxID=652676 RepID=A0A3B1C4X5_9ZZZZ